MPRLAALRSSRAQPLDGRRLVSFPRVLTAGLALWLAACTPVELESRRYACDPSGNREVGSAQCPGDSRCGLEGFCHAVGDVSLPWRCSAASDCERGFQCGLGFDGVSRECHDPDAGVDYRCTSSADCSRGWSCGFDEAHLRRCHDPAAPRAWPCDSSEDCVAGWQCGLGDLGGKECHDPSSPRAWRCLTDADCLGGWRCGLDDQRSGRECHDPAVPRAFACEVASDCVGGWDCGLAANRVQRECHDPSSPQAWPCESDADCAGGWRCNLDGLCVSPAGEALVPLAALAVDGGELLGGGTSGAVDLLSTSFVSDGEPTTTIALARSGALEAFVVTPQAIRTYDLGAPGELTALVAQGPKSTRRDPNIVGAYLPSSDNLVYAAVADAGLRAYTLLPDGGVLADVVRTWSGGVAANRELTRFRTGFSEDRARPPRLVGFTPGNTSSFTFLGGPNEVLHLDPRLSAVAGDHLRDMGDVFIQAPGGPIECTFLVNEQGLWVAEDYFVPGVALNDFYAVNDPGLFGNTKCVNGRANLKVVGFELLRWDRALVTSAPVAGGAPTVSIWDLGPMFTPRGSGARCSSYTGADCVNDRVPFSVVLGPCAPCPRGTLLEAVGVEGPSGFEVQTLCGGNGSAALFYRVNASCAISAVSGPSTVLAANPTPAAHHSRVVGYSTGGRVWRGPEASTAIALALDRVPTAIAARGPGRNDVVFFSPGSLGVVNARLGIASLSQSGLVTGARNDPRWVLSNDLLVDLWGAPSGPESGVLLAQAQGVLGAPRQLVHATTPSGSALAVVGAGRQLWSAELSSAGLAALVPRVGFADDARSLAMAPPGASGLFAEGYAVAGVNVVRLTASSATQWRTDEVALPRSVTPQAVWFDGARARLGLTNGAVLSLPGRVPLAPATAEGSVEDFLGACGRAFALTSGGLDVLVVRPPLVVGEWVPVPLPPGFAPTGLAGGRLFEVDRTLYIVSRAGETARVELTGCP